jgi:predicted ABC-type ATPase
MESNPTAIILAGANGSGKTTIAAMLLKEVFGPVTYVNADVIAQGLSGNVPDAVALQASALLLERLDTLVDKRESFAFETTLAAKSLATRIKHLQSLGYKVLLVYLWLPSSQMAIARVRKRVLAGGHSIPIETIKRRYQAGLKNFFDLYLPLVDQWWLFDNSSVDLPRPIATGSHDGKLVVHVKKLWTTLLNRYSA